MTGAEQRYSNIKCEALGIQGLEKFHHYCFSREVLVITDHKLPIAMFKKDVATMSQHIQQILLKFTNTGSRSYTNLVQRFLVQIGYQGTIT